MEENEWLETVCPDCLQKYKTSYQCLRIGGKRTNFEHRCLDYKTLEDIDKELEYFASLKTKEPRP